MCKSNLKSQVDLLKSSLNPNMLISNLFVLGTLYDGEETNVSRNHVLILINFLTATFSNSVTIKHFHKII